MIVSIWDRTFNAGDEVIVYLKNGTIKSLTISSPTPGVGTLIKSNGQTLSGMVFGVPISTAKLNRHIKNYEKEILHVIN